MIFQHFRTTGSYFISILLIIFNDEIFVYTAIYLLSEYGKEMYENSNIFFCHSPVDTSPSADQYSVLF
jgi:hypothetical protein